MYIALPVGLKSSTAFRLYLCTRHAFLSFFFFGLSRTFHGSGGMARMPPNRYAMKARVAGMKRSTLKRRLLFTVTTRYRGIHGLTNVIPYKVQNYLAKRAVRLGQ
jgi:hypothetical protein